ncbi:YeiH family putative sulfate export transporter [Listeria sp. FSL L7-0233]|uniref:YeiH family protein n=1 Tax=Listeria cossartiae TaxID=2838249 RepID=UPI001627F3E6|nr:YeiH family protein [Listeria cossartiae]MBC2183507.1 YeiH family putative sulfate export transporter [Listeria cossartiae subsp. cossartiae]MBC2185692.1 YeiH family putative sulfate export transporter [Listeria cossartiae subsp. cossartiae]
MSQILFKTKTFWYGIALTFCIATLSYFLAKLPFLMILGQLVTAILIGIIIRALFPVPDQWFTGIQFSNKVILRAGIILLGFRLNLVDIYDAGWRVFLIAALCLSFGITVVYFLAKLFGVDKKLAILVACGTGICGAAAVVAISPQVKADNNQTAVAATIIALLGTIFTIVYTLIYPILPLGPDGYGIFAGATLHEIAHVIAAADPGGTSAVDMAVIVKLTRVALLVPVCFVVAKMVNVGTKNRFSWAELPVPWFIFGFLATSAINSLGIIPASITNFLVVCAYFLIAMSMGGLGLNVHLPSFGKMGGKPFVAAFIGSVLLSAFGLTLVLLFHLAG